MGLFVSGGGGVPKSRLASAATQAVNVLKNTFFVNSSGTVTEGTMVDNSGQTVTASATDKSGSNIRMKIPTRACYDTSSYVQTAASNFGDAAQSAVVSGSTFTSSNGLNVSGTLTDKSGAAVTASSVDKNGTNIRMKVPTTAKYSTNSYVQTAASNLGTAEASQVKEGATFTSSAGVNVTGTLDPISAATEVHAERTGSVTAVSATNGAYYVCAAYAPGSGTISWSGITNVITQQIGCYRTQTSWEPEPGVLASYGRISIRVGKATSTTISTNTSYSSMFAVKLW